MMSCAVACETASGFCGSCFVFFGGEKRQPEIRLLTQARLCSEFEAFCAEIPPFEDSEHQEFIVFLLKELRN